MTKKMEPTEPKKKSRREVTVEIGVGDSKVYYKKTKEGNPDSKDYEVGGNLSSLFAAKLSIKNKKDDDPDKSKGVTPTGTKS